MKTVITAILLLASAVQAHAADRYLLTITAESTGKKAARLGVELDDRNNITAILYLERSDTSSPTRNRFELSKILSKEQVLVAKAGVVDIVTLKAGRINDTQLLLTFKYLYFFHGIFSGADRHKQQMILQFNQHTASYEFADYTTGRIVTQAYAKTKYDEDGKEKGIDLIRFQ
jgi:hypothetical protein